MPVGVIGRGFHEDGARDAAAFCEGQIVFDVEGIAFEWREVIGPRIGIFVRVDEVLMGV